MANVQNVNYEEIPSKAKSLRELGKDINRKLTKIYNSIDEMHNYWYGIRFNELEMSFNDLVSDINELLQLIVGDIPFALETIANDYSNLDRGMSLTSAVNTSPIRILLLDIKNDVGMGFISSEVITIHDSIKQDFETVERYLNEYQSIFSQIDWNSDAANVYKSKFDRIIAFFNNKIDDINAKFDAIIIQTEEDVENAENDGSI